MGGYGGGGARIIGKHGYDRAFSIKAGDTIEIIPGTLKSGEQAVNPATVVGGVTKIRLPFEVSRIIVNNDPGEEIILNINPLNAEFENELPIASNENYVFDERPLRKMEIRTNSVDLQRVRVSLW